LFLQVNDKGNAVIGTRYGRLNGMFGANEMSICQQDLILQEEHQQIENIKSPHYFSF
jgi:hypothetical protein